MSISTAVSTAPAAAARVLLVDDAADMTTSVEALLRLDDFHVSRAIDGPSALRAVAGQTFDAVVLDVMLPGIDGFEVCRRLRRDPVNAGLIIVMLTGLSDTPSKLQGLGVGADDFLVKPVVSRVLTATIRTRLQARDARIKEVREQRQRAIGEIAAAVCHEINNPLTAAIGTIDLILLNEHIRATVRRDLESCQSHLLRIGKILSRMDEVEDRTVAYLGAERMIDLRE